MREELDFKSLRFFSALYRLGNVSPAADALNISQPTGSLLLKKLRDHFADPLFVRVGQRMMPTPRADAIAPTVFTLLQLADNDLAVKPEFLPQQSQRNFTIGMTDISQMTLLPLLQIALQQQAADGITFTIQNLDEQTLNALESGKCDLAIGYLTQLPDSVYQQHLSINRMSAWRRKSPTYSNPASCRRLAAGKASGDPRGGDCPRRYG